jgi:hypothetical protein
MMDIAEIKQEAMLLLNNHVRGQHSNNKVIRLCQEIERLESDNARLKSEYAAAGVLLQAYDAELVKRGIVVEIEAREE